MAITIKPETLVPMDLFSPVFPVSSRPAYADPGNLLLGEAVYRKEARLWLHEDLAKVVLRAAANIYQTHGFRMVLHDGLRTVEAQQKMLETGRVKANPHWLEEPRLLSPPATGGHPRAMAIDIALESGDGKTVDMGTEFDFLAEDARPEKNPAHRLHPHLSKEVKANRKILEVAMLESAQHFKMAILPLPQEWWDFRFPAEIYNQYAPISDKDLPPQMRMTDVSAEGPDDLPPSHFEKLCAGIARAAGGL